MTFASFGSVSDAGAWLDRAASAAMSVPSTAMARRLEMWRAACAAARGEVGDMRRHYERAAELAGGKTPGGRAEALCALAVHSVKLGVERGDADLLDQAKRAAEDTLSAVSSLTGQLPWEGVAHGVLAVVADIEGQSDTAAEEARIALSLLHDPTHILHFIDVLWAAGRVLIRSEEPEAEELRKQIAQGLGFLSMGIIDPTLKQKWFELGPHRELAELVGFELSDAFGSPDAGVDLADDEVELLREITSGSSERTATEAEVAGLLSRLGVGSETEAIEYAIKAGVSWQ